MAEGIEVRTAKTGRKSYRANVWSDRDRKLIRKTFPTMAAAKSWRSEAVVALRKGELRPPERKRLQEAAEQWLEDTRAGLIRNRSGDPYKPSAIRGYEQALRLRVLPELGAARLTDIRRAELQALIDRLLSAGHDPSTIRRSARSFAAP